MLFALHHLKIKKTKNIFIRLNSVQTNVKDSKKNSRRNLSMSINISQDCKNFGNSFLQPDYNIQKNYKIFNDIIKVNINNLIFIQIIIYN